MYVRQTHSLWEVLPEQAVGVFVGATLPGTLWITEVDLDIRVQGEAFVISHFFASIPGERRILRVRLKCCNSSFFKAPRAWIKRVR